MRTRYRIFFGFVLLPVCVLADSRADFSGEWIVRGGVSPADKSAGKDSHMPASGHHHAGDHGGMGGGHSMGGMSGHGMQGGRSWHRGAGRGGMHVHANPDEDPRLKADALIIRQSDVVFDIDADGARTPYRFDNRYHAGVPYAGKVTLTWAAPEMLIRTKSDSGTNIEERYTLSADGKTLTLRIHEQGSDAQDTHDITRVFVRDGDEARSESGPTLPP